MGLLLFQLQASQVACHGCENAGQDRRGVRFQWPHCASPVRKEPYQGPNPGVQYQLTVEFVAPPWNSGHYDCSQTDDYKTEACCGVPEPRFSSNAEYVSSACVRPDGKPLDIK
ncbi:hypothetical protein PGT21_036740 [Puccinia graminis f. sp. tritici]|uniref:Uncharacterized protein n=2 Tax=Puccinia graminis f. sp. tritici TaxID=56615 RepID=E3L3B4_PUCGT|nr:uncharacterized protein PGTG_17311 [Puccinia graminis f. sp. tritici CRL 75-36-700-3]EFP91039.1 hypothetical protein PGTG_17311 [Puccinia graminis f. sp. tritici CRL 75-36-700-3]KAA1119985.1 hypothetical protein PGT21_036740 [Puccinia graminis f. sp. tritici]